MDGRHKTRRALLQDLFACTFSDVALDRIEFPEHKDELEKILAELPELDIQIQSAAPERPLQQIAKIDLAIMRLIMFESKHKPTPKRVLVDEAIELAKAYGSDSSAKFMNGVLAKLLLSEV
ncbi:MAG: transcription antitermination protein NusB [bacterium]|nr:transcription antitermination protein NusB [bacterium]